VLRATDSDFESDSKLEAPTAGKLQQPTRGAGKKNPTDPPVHLLNLRPTHPPSDFFFFDIFFSTFLGVSRQGKFKNTIKYFYKKSMSKKNQKFRQKFRCQFFLDFFCFIAFSGVFQRREFKNTTKNVLPKKIVSKSFYKKFDQKSKTDFFSNFFNHVFGRFSMRGVQKHDKKYRKNKSDPIPFSYSDPPTHHGGPRFFFLPAP
jgi:hypothetical protein